jgi:hypothetical protein
MTQPVALEAGHAYVVQGRSLGLLLYVLEREVRNGRRGLIVSRIRPSTLRERYDIADATALWLTDVPGVDRLSIADVERPQRIIDLAQGDNRTVVVALDGIEYLTSHIGSDATVKVLESLKDNVTDQGGILLVRADVAALDGKTEAFLGREFEYLPESGRDQFRIHDVFVIDAAAGILLTHAAERSEMEIDTDVMAGMLTVLVDFVRTSFAEGADQLQRLEMGELAVVIERAKRFILALTFTGPEPPNLRPRLREFADSADQRFGSLLDTWDGDVLRLGELKTLTEQTFLEGRGEEL